MNPKAGVVLIELLKKKPWANLVEQLTTNVPPILKGLFTFYTLLLPLVVIGIHAFDVTSGLWVTLVLNLCAAVVFYFIPRYLRSGNQLLSLDRTHQKPPFSFIYHTVLKLGSLFAVIIFAYTAILLVMLVLEKTTGISQSQEIPDLSHMNFLDITYNALTAGLTEEVWRIAAILTLLLFFKKITGLYWTRKTVQVIALFISFVFTSFVFGWLHTFGYSDSYFSVPITVQLGLIGMVLASISLLTRRLWLAVFFHFFFDFVSFTLNAKAKPLMESEQAGEAFVEKNMVWFMGIGYLFIFLTGMFFLSIYLLRYSKGGKKCTKKLPNE